MAWWLKKEFPAKADKIKDIPIKAFNANWQAAQALTLRSMKSQLTPSELADIRRSETMFERSTSIDDDTALELFVVGVYRLASEGQGRFLAVIKEGNVEKLFEYPGERGFSSLLQDGDAIRWFKCLACDDFDSIRWDGEDYTLEPGAGEFTDAGA